MAKKLSYRQEQRKLGMFKDVNVHYEGRRACRTGLSTGNYVKSRHHYESGRFRFDLTNCEARSYDWWVFVLKVGDTIYVNCARYSMQTSGHQSMADHILAAEMPERHGLKVKNVWYREGLQGLDKAIKNTRYEIDQLVTAISNPRSRAATNDKRRERINELYAYIAETEKLMPLFNAQIEANESERSDRYDRYEQALEQRRKQRVPKYKQVTEIILKSIHGSEF